MADARFFVIPRASLITLPRYYSLNTNNDAYIAFDEVKAWTYQQQDRGLVVIIDLFSGDEMTTLQFRSIVAYDGPWVDQLRAVSSDPSIGSKELKIAAGGLTGEYATPQPSPPSTGPGNFVLFTGPYAPYVTQANANVSFADPGYITVDWQTANPAADVWFQVYATLNIKAASNNAEYGVGFLLNGIVNANTIVRVLKETPSDTEEITLHGHRPVPNGSKIGIGLCQYDGAGTKPPDIVSINFRVFGFYYGT